MPKETLRRREQKAATFAVRSGTAERRPLEPEEAQAFFRAIDARDAAGFGIRKLAVLDVDGLHQAPECITWERRITLLYYAAWRKRDHFVNALLHAKADPSVRDEGLRSPRPARNEGPAQQLVNGLRMESAVWLSHAMVQLRFRGKRVQNLGFCEECGQQSKDRALNGFAAMLAWPCGHRCCEDCLWKRSSLVAKGMSAAAELPCPKCQVGPTSGSYPTASLGEAEPPSEKKQDWECSCCGYTNFARRQSCRNCQVQQYSQAPLTEQDASMLSADKDAFILQWQPLSSLQRREATLERFKALPTEPVETDTKDAKSRPRFQAQHPRSAAAAKLGDTKQERTTELLKVGVSGDVVRLTALLEAGVDLDATNEYGQTALFLAACHNAGEAIALLAWAGADLDRTANGGCSPWACAVANAHQGAMHALEEAGAKPTASWKLLDFDTRSPKLQWLIPHHSDLAGAGSCLVEGSFPETCLRQLEDLFASLPKAERTKSCSSDRSYFCDSEGAVQKAFQSAVDETLKDHGLRLEVTMPHMRFLHYVEVGGGLPPHVDLARTDELGRRSTHTFILYLGNCVGGGETVLLNVMEDTEEAVVATVEPERGRFLLFPHMCPHLARPITAPKLLLRGELRLVSGAESGAGRKQTLGAW
ncbi:unnamed protein product, partial [Effrenium voratum]